MHEARVDEVEDTQSYLEAVAAVAAGRTVPQEVEVEEPLPEPEEELLTEEGE